MWICVNIRSSIRTVRSIVSWKCILLHVATHLKCVNMHSPTSDTFFHVTNTIFRIVMESKIIKVWSNYLFDYLYGEALFRIRNKAEQRKFVPSYNTNAARHISRLLRFQRNAQLPPRIRYSSASLLRVTKLRKLWHSLQNIRVAFTTRQSGIFSSNV